MKYLDKETSDISNNKQNNYCSRILKPRVPRPSPSPQCRGGVRVLSRVGRVRVRVTSHEGRVRVRVKN